MSKDSLDVMAHGWRSAKSTRYYEPKPVTLQFLNGTRVDLQRKNSKGEDEVLSLHLANREQGVDLCIKVLESMAALPQPKEGDVKGKLARVEQLLRMFKVSYDDVEPAPPRGWVNLDRNLDSCANCGENAEAHGLDFKLATCGGFVDLGGPRCQCGHTRQEHADYARRFSRPDVGLCPQKVKP